MTTSQGKKFLLALQKHKPLQIVGTINAFSALLAERAGFHAIYLSGAGVANASYGVPDLGITTLSNVLEDVNRITSATELPLLVDIDTGWGSALNIQRAIKQMSRAHAAGVHIEDQVFSKRCGHRPGKKLVSISEMQDRIKAAVDAKEYSDFVVMARTDAMGVEDLDRMIVRANAYAEVGADMLFAEAVKTLDQYQKITSTIKIPVLANITEFGQTPLFTLEELKKVGVSMVLYPLSAFRAMSLTAMKIYEAIKKEGTQKNVISLMQTRQELYECLDYEKYEQYLDEFSECETK